MGRTRLVLFVVAIASLSACSGEPDATDTTDTASKSIVSTTTFAAIPTSSSPVPVTTAETATTSGLPSSTTTSSLPTTTTTDVYYSIAIHSSLWHPEALPGSGGWWGSGCSPGSDTLPNGIWWGYLRDSSPTSVMFDLACILFEEGSADDPATEDYAWVIENKNPRVRVVPVDPTAEVICEGSNPFPYVEWIDDDRLSHGDQGREGGVWLYVNGGTVTEIEDMVLAG
jgi:hypothetical protein